MRTETVGSVSEFLGGRQAELFSVKVERHFKKYGMIYKIAGVTVILLTGIGADVLASSGIDVEAGKLYKELIGLGKWIIVFKGGFDILKMIGSGDFDSAKKSFFGYLLTYLLLLGLPYGLDKVDSIFRNISPTSTTRGW